MSLSVDTSAVPVYSGYMSIWPLCSARSAICSLPRLRFFSTLKPLACSAWA